jgi:glyceraldehyde-3-phosphate dehydrogenase/erythrose-4-phosphate dehydrogenase
MCVQVIPELNGKLTGMAFRVPTQVRAVLAVCALHVCCLRTLYKAVHLTMHQQQQNWTLWAAAWRAVDSGWLFLGAISCS